ncbi:hypothetical protein TNCV_2401031 [Trichonephila clavipes]|nr:hypothetical protein TNCV_2401031 [Trichonephila clavipes]
MGCKIRDSCSTIEVEQNEDPDSEYMVTATAMFELYMALQEFIKFKERLPSDQAVKSSPRNKRPGIVFLEFHDGCSLQQGQNNRISSVCDVMVHCQMAVNVYQRHPVIKHCASPNHDVRCRTCLMLGEMAWFVSFSWTLPYPSTAIIPPQTETTFISEQYSMTFDDTYMMMRTPC